MSAGEVQGKLQSTVPRLILGGNMMTLLWRPGASCSPSLAIAELGYMPDPLSLSSEMGGSRCRRLSADTAATSKAQSPPRPR